MALLRRTPVLRAAAISGGAYYAGKRRQEAYERESAQRAQIAEIQVRAATPGSPALSPGPSREAIAMLERLGKLRELGVLTDAELAQQKALLLGP